MKFKDLFRNEKELQIAYESLEPWNYHAYTHSDLGRKMRLYYICSVLSAAQDDDPRIVLEVDVSEFLNLNDLGEILAGMAVKFIDCVTFNKDFPCDINYDQFLNFIGYFSEKVQDYAEKTN